MATNITSFAQLQAELMKLISDTMIDITVDAEIVLKTKIKEDVYDVYTPNPNYYQRTGEFMNSVDSKIAQSGTIFQSEVFNDPNKMQAVAPYDGNNNTGQHYSTYSYSPMDYRDYLAETINFGINGKKVFGDGVYSRARPYFDDAQKIVFSTFSTNMIKGLNERGIKNVV